MRVWRVQRTRRRRAWLRFTAKRSGLSSQVSKRVISAPLLYDLTQTSPVPSEQGSLIGDLRVRGKLCRGLKLTTRPRRDVCVI